MNTESFARLFDRLWNTYSGGSRQTTEGSWLIGHVPHRGPEAYFHSVFAPLDEARISQIELNIGRMLPEALKALYRCANGMHLFTAALSIYGLQLHPGVRSGDEARQPFCMTLSNVHERPDDAQSDDVFFGFYRRDGSQLVMSPGSERVRRCRQWTTQTLNEWASFDEMLFGEVSRLSALFDETGRQKDPDAPTTPQP